MRNHVAGLTLTFLTAACSVGLAGQAISPERQLVNRAADALGGRERLLQLRTLQIVGYGELAYFNVLYDRDAQGGELFHVYTEPFEGRFFFEIIQRKNGYAGYGAANPGTVGYPYPYGAQMPYGR